MWETRKYSVITGNPNLDKPHMQSLKFTMEYSYYLNKGHSVCDAASFNGHLGCLKFAHENGCDWYGAISGAASNGHLDCLKYAHENGCTWVHQLTPYVAAKGGHLECLKYAHEHGCEWNNQICYGAVEGGHIECLKYAYLREWKST